MKRLTTLLIAIFAICSLSAQTPRAVIKEVLDGDRYKAQEKFDKLNDKSKSKTPELCALAEALLLSQYETSDERLFRAYEILSNNWDAIRSSTDLYKLMKGCDTTLDALRMTIEQRSLSHIKYIDTEQRWRDYLALALAASHSDIGRIEQGLKDCIYNDSVEANTVAAYDRFLELYPTSEYSDDVVARRTILLYDEAMTTTDESIVEKFVKEFPNYEHTGNVERRLMNMRYERVTTVGTLEELQWFLAIYPDHEQRGYIRQLMADKVYPTLEESVAAFEQFIADYPDAQQIDEAKYRLEVLKINLNKSRNDIVAYIVKYGYDRNYPRFLRYLVEEHDIYLHNSDIARLSMLRYRTSEGKEGYLSLEGDIVIEAKFDATSQYSFPVYSDQNELPHDFRRDRNLAIVTSNDKWGVLKSNGEWFIEPNYLSIAFLEKEIICAKRIESNGYEDCYSDEYICCTYTYEGNILRDNYSVYHDPGMPMLRSYDTKWFDADITILRNSDGWTDSMYDENGSIIASSITGLTQLTPDYKSYTSADGAVYAIDRNGDYKWFRFREFTLRHIKDNIIFGVSNEGRNALIYLDEGKIYYQDYKKMETMSHGRIATKFDDDSWGYLDSDFNTIVKGYKYATSFVCGVAVICDDKGWHLIDLQGNSVGGIYEALMPINGYPGLFCAGIGGKFGIIDSYGDIVVPLENEPTFVVQNVADSIMEHIVIIYDGIAHWRGEAKTPLFKKREATEPAVE